MTFADPMDTHYRDKKAITWLVIACWLTYSLGALWWLESDAPPYGLPICTTNNN